MIRASLFSAIALGMATPAAAATTYDFTAVFGGGPLARISGSFTRDGDVLTGLDVTIGDTRFDLSNSGFERSDMLFTQVDSIFGMLDGSPAVTQGFDDFAFSIYTTLGFDMTRTVNYDFSYVVAGDRGFFSTDAVTIAERAVPEPATWAMMIAGFALVGGAARRRPTAALPA